MASDDLSSPLRQRTLLRSLRAIRPASPALATGLFAVLIVGILAWLQINYDPLGGEPHVVLPLEPPQQAADAAAEGTAQTHELGMRSSVEGADPLAQAPDTHSEESAPEPARAGPQKKTTAQPAAATAVAALIEKGPDGPLPKIAADGRRPSAVYAAPVQLPAGAPAEAARVAIVIGGMGISATGTTQAIAKLPGSVTLAFAPYADGLADWVARARQNGHEVMLQVPMEPFDYPDNDPGPYTLLTNLSAEDNMRRLHWLLSRFTGYTGVVNYMGARFTAAPEALGPVMRELKQRGLLYLDDGTSPRSRAGDLGAGMGLEAGVADVVIDAVQSGPAIDQALERLETLALEKGQAVAMGSGLPITLERIAEWSESLEEKGIVLVPVSALLGKGRS